MTETKHDKGAIALVRDALDLMQSAGLRNDDGNSVYVLPQKNFDRIEQALQRLDEMIAKVPEGYNPIYLNQEQRLKYAMILYDGLKGCDE